MRGNLPIINLHINLMTPQSMSQLAVKRKRKRGLQSNYGLEQCVASGATTQTQSWPSPSYSTAAFANSDMIAMNFTDALEPEALPRYGTKSILIRALRNRRIYPGTDWPGLVVLGCCVELQ
jgi:hypothetical protein